MSQLNVNTIEPRSGSYVTIEDLKFIQSGTGASSRTVQNKLREFISVKDYGALGDGSTDDALAIQAAIDAVNTASGGVVFFPAGTYIIGTGLTTYSKIILLGESNLVSIIKVKNSSNINAITTTGFSSFTGANKWFVDTESVPHAFGFIGLQLDGNKANNSSGSGIRIYGKRYIVQDCIIHDTEGVGFYSECAFKGGQNDYRDMPESNIDGLYVWGCVSHGIQYRGPHDGYIKFAVSSSNGGEGVLIQGDGSTYSGTCDIGFIHSYGNTLRGFATNIKLKAQHLIGESNTQEGVDIESAASATQIGMLEAYGNSVGSNSFFQVTIAAGETMIGIHRIDLNSTGSGAGGIQITGANSTIGNGVVKDAVAKTSAIGVDIDAGGVIYKGKILNFNGTTATGLRDSQTSAANSLNLDVYIEECTTHWNHVRTTNGGFYKVRMTSATTGQTMFTGAAPDTSGREFWVVRGANSADVTTQLSKNRGTGVIANGNTSVTITHGLIATPKEINITPTNNFGTATGWYVSSIGSTTFDVNSDGDPGASTATFNWEAMIDGGV
jgi:hypothetical protein